MTPQEKLRQYRLEVPKNNKILGELKASLEQIQNTRKTIQMEQHTKEVPFELLNAESEIKKKITFYNSRQIALRTLIRTYEEKLEQKSVDY